MFVVAATALAGSLGACVRELEPVISEDALTDETGYGYGYSAAAAPACFDAAAAAPRWHVPAPLHQGLCSAAQTQALLRCYVTHDLETTTCRAYFRKAENVGCQKCALSKETAASYGALVIDHDGELRPNVGGCIAGATNDRAVDGCGAKVQLRERCLRDACASCRNADRSRCETAARANVCAAYDDAPSCYEAATAPGAPARECRFEGPEPERAREAILAFCGP